MQNYNEARDVRSSHSQPADFFKTDVSIDVTTDNIREIHTLIDSPGIKPKVRFNRWWDGDPTKGCGTYS